jgi:2',3'-cyclic-nucleotide 2'-phosphodiesterase/3'-nucleotidase
LIDLRWIEGKHYLSNILSLKPLSLRSPFTKKLSKSCCTFESPLNMLKNTPRKPLFSASFLLFLLFSTSCHRGDLPLKIAVTTDVHGMIFPYDFIRREPSDYSLAHIYNYVVHERAGKDTLFFLLDNGDFLQGQPTVYYYNFIDTLSEHLSSRVMNYMGYDAGSVGNHDIEAGPAVYRRVRNEFEFPWLAANAVYEDTGEPCFEPYTILRAGRRKIAVLGMITPGIPQWLPKTLWPGMEFLDMVETARFWVPEILAREDPDLLVGLFHSGTDASYGGSTESHLNENAVTLVAEQVPGFDVIFAGHDHRVSVQWVSNTEGDSVLIIDPGSHGRFAGEVTVRFEGDILRLTGKNVSMKDYPPSDDFLEHFDPEYRIISTYLQDTITWLTEDMSGLDALWGPSTMTSLIHELQLELSGAPISFAAPLSISAVLKKGPLLVSDLFKLYRYENTLYTMELSGREIDGFLEHAVGNWFNTLTGSEGHLLQFEQGHPGKLAHPYYNFSSAAGIDYLVDLSREPGQRIEIQSLADGSPFDVDSTYEVAINSYRGNGGGGHLTGGAGIPQEELSARVVRSTERDLRYSLMEFLGKSDTLHPRLLDNWKCVPGDEVTALKRKDRRLMEEVLGFQN